ncbi:hypothetical protein [Saccharicrinis aurantiacus]|uniref:hypothetical protein n=1 Tax=Saccharicrinis aurantiacus TaxID=1849719 RepID=UPI0024900890|nr:hypothetical protein [Saccharicrinis aurantiacus]
MKLSLTSINKWLDPCHQLIMANFYWLAARNDVALTALRHRDERGDLKALS